MQSPLTVSNIGSERVRGVIRKFIVVFTVNPVDFNFCEVVKKKFKKIVFSSSYTNLLLFWPKFQ